MTEDVQTLLDRADITEVRQQFGWALDTRDWTLLASLFTDSVEVDLPALGASAGPLSSQGLVELYQRPFRRPPHEMGTQQLYSGAVIQLAGDKATTRTYLVGHHHVPGMDGGEDVTLRAAYTDQLVRTADGWRINGTALHVFSLTGNAAIFA